MNEKIRPSYFLGNFYPDNYSLLSNQIRGYFHDLTQQSDYVEISNMIKNKKIFGIIVPHSDYLFSGKISSFAYSLINDQEFENFIIIGSNHLGIGDKLSIMKEGKWETPLGLISVNSDIASSIEKQINLNLNKTNDNIIFSYDKVIELQLPFLQYKRSNKSIKFVPLIIRDQSIKFAKKLGKVISEIIIQNKYKSLVIGSSNFSHYESSKIAQKKDMVLIQSIKTLDISKFYNMIQELNISLCGYGVIATVMTIAKHLGSTTSLLLSYGHSDSSRNSDSDNVVGYASMMFI